jgi:hypothetical protein
LETNEHSQSDEVEVAVEVKVEVEVGVEVGDTFKDQKIQGENESNAKIDVPTKEITTEKLTQTPVK